MSLAISPSSCSYSTFSNSVPVYLSSKRMAWASWWREMYTQSGPLDRRLFQHVSNLPHVFSSIPTWQGSCCASRTVRWTSSLGLSIQYWRSAVTTRAHARLPRPDKILCAWSDKRLHAETTNKSLLYIVDLYSSKSPRRFRLSTKWNASNFATLLMKLGQQLKVVGAKNSRWKNMQTLLNITIIMLSFLIHQKPYLYIIFAIVNCFKSTEH